MKILKPKLVDQLENIICDVCGNFCKKEYNIEYAKIIANWGFETKKDGQVYEIDLCENCFDKTLEFINSISNKKIEAKNDELTS